MTTKDEIEQRVKYALWGPSGQMRQLTVKAGEAQAWQDAIDALVEFGQEMLEAGRKIGQRELVCMQCGNVADEVDEDGLCYDCEDAQTLAKYRGEK